MKKKCPSRLRVNPPNPDKFQCISLDRFGRPPISISVEGNTIPSSDSIKVLGVTLDKNLQYNTHIIYSNLCSKASTQINVMKRIGKYLNTDYRIAMYKSFISSNFSYCPVSWMFCGKRNSDKLEKLQERALRFVFSDYTSPYSDLLKRGNFLSLSALRIRYLAIEIYKCVHGLNPPYLNELFTRKDTRYNLRDSNRLQQPEFQTARYGFKSFRYYGSKLWNSLRADVKHSENLYHFKKILLNGAYRVNVMGLLYNGPLTRYVKLKVAHAPGMPGTFSPAADFKGNR